VVEPGQFPGTSINRKEKKLLFPVIGPTHFSADENDFVIE
jgi:hypothetical protein